MQQTVESVEYKRKATTFFPPNDPLPPRDAWFLSWGMYDVHPHTESARQLLPPALCGSRQGKLSLHTGCCILFS